MSTVSNDAGIVPTRREAERIKRAVITVERSMSNRSRYRRRAPLVAAGGGTTPSGSTSFNPCPATINNFELIGLPVIDPTANGYVMGLDSQGCWVLYPIAPCPTGS